MPGIFDFVNDMFNYEERKVMHTEVKNEQLIVDTSKVNDSNDPYEPAISSPLYNEGDWIIVESYKNKDDAIIGHNKHVKIMTAEVLPEKLLDASTCELTKILKACGGKMEYKKAEEISVTKNIA